LGFLYGIVYKLPEKLAYLKNDNADFKDLQSLVTGPVGPSGSESHNDKVDASALSLQPKSYKRAVIRRLQCHEGFSKLTAANSADGAYCPQSVSMVTNGFTTVGRKKKDGIAGDFPSLRTVPAETYKAVTFRGRSSTFLPLVARKIRSKALSVSRFSLVVASSDIEISLK
jgi:hypothetical protein